MATRRYSLSNDFREEADGADAITEAVGAATVTTAMEFTVDLAVIADKQRIITALDRLKDYLLEGQYPPV